MAVDRADQSGMKFQENGIRFQWSYRTKETIEVSIAGLNSPIEAKERLRKLIGRDGRRNKKRIEGIGDEAYQGASTYGKSRSAMYFRKANVVVWVDAPSVELLRRFATYIADQVPAV